MVVLDTRTDTGNIKGTDRKVTFVTRERRVLHLITRFLGGGAETTTVNALFALMDSEDTYDVRLGFGRTFDSDRVSEIEAAGFQTISFGLIRHYNPFTALFAVLEVALYLWREDIDIIHTHSTEAGIIGRWAARLVGTPIVIHEVHGDPITSDRHPVLNRLVHLLERISAPMATKIVVKSTSIRETYLERGIGERDQYEVIYHGVDIDQYENASAIELDDVDSEHVLLFVGRLEDGKGIFDLLDAMERLTDSMSVGLVIAGEGPLADKLENEIKERGLRDSVWLLGYRDDVPSLMHAADALVLPSYREGTPRVITEALASGLPVIATEIAGIPEMVDDGTTGILIEPGDVDGITDAVQSILSGQAGLQFTTNSERLSKFSETTAKKRYQGLYTQLLSSEFDE